MTTAEQQETLQHLRQVREQALEHARRARELALERRDLIRGLIAGGLSQSDVARELGVSRHAIQTCLACWPAQPLVQPAGGLTRSSRPATGRR